MSVVGVLGRTDGAGCAGAGAGVALTTALAVEGLDGGVGTAEEGRGGDDAVLNHCEECDESDCQSLVVVLAGEGVFVVLMSEDGG